MFGKTKKKTAKATPFFDSSAREKKKILEHSMREAVRAQRDLIKKYNLCYAEA